MYWTKKITRINTNITPESYHFHLCVLTFKLCSFKLQVCNKKKLLSACKDKLYTSEGFPLFDATLVSSYYHLLLLWFWSLYILAISKIIVFYLSMYVTPCITLLSFTCVVINDRLSCFCMTEWFSTMSHFFSCASHIRLSCELLEVGYGEAIVKILPI